jgi:hypothetical protein
MMGNALKKDDVMPQTVGLDIQDALAAAIERSIDVGQPKRSILDLVSKEEWANLCEDEHNILVFDPA